MVGAQLWTKCWLVLVLINGSISFSDADETMDKIKKVTKVLKPGEEKYIEDLEDIQFQMFCRIGEKKNVAYFFRSASLRITSSAEDIKLLKGYSPRDVYRQYEERTWLVWIANVLPWRVRDTGFPTFNTSCIGISTSKPYTAMVVVKALDPWKVLTFFTGLAVFFMAPQLSQSTMFFYTSGTLVGGLAAALVVLFIIQRFIPKGKFGLSFMSILYFISIYYVGETWKNFEQLVHQRLPYIVAYLFSGAFMAFLACYRWGPPSHPKTLDILCWSLQILGLVLVHFSSDFVELSTIVILIVIAYNQINLRLFYQIEKYYRKWFPKKQRFLTEEEFITQGAIETAKSLENLRKFVESPEAKPWKLITKLKNPRRFSNFVSGTSHLSDDEMLAYDYDDCLMYEERAALPAPPAPRGRTQPNMRELAITDDDDSENELPGINGAEVTDDDD